MKTYRASMPFYYKGVYYRSTAELVRTLEPEFVYVENFFTAFGKTFKSVNEMADYFDINTATLRKAIKKGIDLETAITGIQKGERLGIPAKDFLGNSFVSLTAMCAYWGTEKGTFYNRFCRGLDLQSCIMGITPHNQLLFLKANRDKFTEEQYNDIFKQVTDKINGKKDSGYL